MKQIFDIQLNICFNMIVVLSYVTSYVLTTIDIVLVRRSQRKTPIQKLHYAYWAGESLINLYHRGWYNTDIRVWIVLSSKTFPGQSSSQLWVIGREGVFYFMTMILRRECLFLQQQFRQFHDHRELYNNRLQDQNRLFSWSEILPTDHVWEKL